MVVVCTRRADASWELAKLRIDRPIRAPSEAPPPYIVQIADPLAAPAALIAGPMQALPFPILNHALIRFPISILVLI